MHVPCRAQLLFGVGMPWFWPTAVMRTSREGMGKGGAQATFTCSSIQQAPLQAGLRVNCWQVSSAKGTPHPGPASLGTRVG